ATVAFLARATHRRDVGQELGMPRARGLQLLPVGELVLVARPLEDNEAEAALAAVDHVAQHADEGRDAGHGRDHEMDGNLSSRVKTPFGRGRRETASPTRSVQSFGVSSPCCTSSRKSSRKASCGEETIE